MVTGELLIGRRRTTPRTFFGEGRSRLSCEASMRSCEELGQGLPKQGAFLLY
jgi:hypothetical protein